ncbi:S1 family peptidase [Amycolatopsis minnesotensis]|uniref:S1 family peptidase n=1 Tax=Amycolatopsis minnesotensis TaxID=337894 RepID=A0ABN2QJF7_9PSEU
MNTNPLGRRRVPLAALAAACAFTVFTPPATAAPDRPADASTAEVTGVATSLGISLDAARTRLRQQAGAHRVARALPRAVTERLAGTWFDPASGKLAVAVTDQAAADEARAAGAQPKLVARGRAELHRLVAEVRAAAGGGIPGLNSYGADPVSNTVNVSVNRTKANGDTDRFLSRIRALPGVTVTESASSPRQQSGTIRTGNPWWPGSETNCSVGFSVTDPAGGKAFLTAGHCTNDANQAAYGASGRQNRIGTSNAGGTHSVNAREGDMGLVSVTQPGWNLSAEVNTWGGAAVTVTGSTDAVVGDQVCHSGNTSHWRCGTVTYVNQTVDYGGGLVIEGLTYTDACSLGGDSGGGWLVNSKATGLHDGGPSRCVDNPGKDDQSIFQPVTEALAKWNLTLTTGTA